MLRVRLDITHEPLVELHIQRDWTDMDDAVGNYTVEYFEGAFSSSSRPVRRFRIMGFEREKGVGTLAALALSKVKGDPNASNV